MYWSNKITAVKTEKIYAFRKRSTTSNSSPNIIGHFVPLRSVLSYGTRFRRGRPPGLAAPDHTVPYGTDLSGHASQALRARLRSGCPYGTKIHSPRRGFD